MEKTNNERLVELAVRRKLAYRSKLAQLGFNPDSPELDPVPLQMASSSSEPTATKNKEMEKTKNERSVELAVRRKLAYRSKLAHLGFNPDSPDLDPIPLQMASSSSEPMATKNKAMEMTKNDRSVELAVRKKLAYRSKLTHLGFNPDSPELDPIPLQIASYSSEPIPTKNKVPSSSYPPKASIPLSEPRPESNQFRNSNLQNHILKPLPKQVQIPISNSNPNTTFPRPNLSGNKRKEIPNDYHEYQAQEPKQKPKPKPKPKPYIYQPDYITMITPVGYPYCKLCQVPCSCPLNLQQHLNGKQHKNKMHLLECSKQGVTPPFCETCHISCTNKDILKVHYNSKKHTSRVRELEEGGGERKLYRKCDLCEIWCMDEAAYQQHLQGRKHIARLYEEENKKSSS